MILFEAYLDKGGMHCGIRCIDCGEIRGYTDVGYDHFEFVRGNDRANVALDATDIFVGKFKSRSRWCLDIDHELPGIGSREIGAANKREDQCRDQNDCTCDV